MQDRKTAVLRAFVAWRFVENILGVAVLFIFQPVNPCSAISAGEDHQDVRYLTSSCVTCCRGPVNYESLTIFTAGTGLLYALSWTFGFVLDTFVYNTVAAT